MVCIMTLQYEQCDNVKPLPVGRRLANEKTALQIMDIRPVKPMLTVSQYYAAKFATLQYHNTPASAVWRRCLQYDESPPVNPDKSGLELNCQIHFTCMASIQLAL